jgi:hypothetical protein
MYVLYIDLTYAFSMSGWTKLFVMIFWCYWTWQLIRFVYDIPQLIRMYNFYTYLLDIPDVSMIIIVKSITLIITLCTLV